MRLVIVAAVLCAACASPPVEWAGQHRGVVLDPFRARPTQSDFDAIAALGASHVGLYVWATMERFSSPRIVRFDRGEGTLRDWSFGPYAMREMGIMARRAGLRLVVFPTFADFPDGHWRGEARMESETDWEEFFEGYRDFVLTYADLASEAGAVGFSVGTELRETVHRVAEWRSLIDAVRARFDGWLTYAANWDDYYHVPWWDALDRIGVQAYFELGSPRDSIRGRIGGRPLRRAIQFGLTNAWAPVRDSLRAFARRTGRPVVFTEIGYKSHAASTAHPWDWTLAGEVDTLLQAEAYRAAFDMFEAEPWFHGFYWWKWHPAADSTDHARDFTPQGKPAERVLRDRWRSDGGW